jgi:hypothetical protein
MSLDAAIAVKREIFSAGLGPSRWYVAHSGKTRGPLSDIELIWLAGDGSLRPQDLIWRPGYLGWTQADQIAGLLIPPDVPDGGASPPPDSTTPDPPAPSRLAAPAPMPAVPPAPIPAAPPPPTPAAAPSPMPATGAPAPEAAAEPADDSLRALLLAMGTPSQPTASYVQRHWRGDLPLVWSFWVNGVLLTGPVVALFAWFIFAMDGATHLPLWLGGLGVPAWAWSFATRLLLIPAIAIQTWCIVGIFRSACRREGLWGEVATATAVCSALCCTVFTLLMLRG